MEGFNSDKVNSLDTDYAPNGSLSLPSLAANIPIAAFGVKKKLSFAMTNRKAEKPTIVFVYNADSGAFNLLTDMAHKIFSPETYSCNLCALTHSNFGMKKQWKKFLESIDADMEFLHADEFKNKYNFQETALPAVYKRDKDGNLKIMIDAPIINECRSIDDLIRQFKV